MFVNTLETKFLSLVKFVFSSFCIQSYNVERMNLPLILFLVTLVASIMKSTDIDDEVDLLVDGNRLLACNW